MILKRDSVAVIAVVTAPALLATHFEANLSGNVSIKAELTRADRGDRRIRRQEA
jgi:hypothetical protein